MRMDHLSEVRPYLRYIHRFDDGRTAEQEWALDHHDIYRLLGLDPNRHLPEQGLRATKIGNVTVWVLSKEQARILAKLRKQPFVHRVECDCPDCGMTISAGKLQQHLKGCEQYKAKAGK